MKRLFTLLLVLVLCLCSLPVAAQEAEQQPGDVNVDGAVNAKDALVILLYSVEKILLNEQQIAAAEVSSNGEINAEDALLILQYAVWKIEYFPKDKVDIAIVKDTFYWNIKQPLSNRFDHVQIIETYEQFEALRKLDLWVDNVDDSAFTPDFFETNSLFIVGARSYHRNENSDVEQIYVVNNTLYAQMTDPHSCVAEDNTLDQLFITVIEKIKAPYQTIHLDVFNVYLGSSRDNPEDWDSLVFPVL